jgi:ABC-type branched-subunit amino acid transport system substrate-binding protein
MTKRTLSMLPVAALIAAGLAAGSMAAEPAVTGQTILFGQSTALEGPASALGIGMRDGIAAAFKEANDAGGIHGRKLELKSYDDGYEPDRAIVATRKLIETDRVFALIGEVGTPTSKAAQPIATEAGVPFIGPYTGAEFLRDPGLRNVVNLRASYYQETETWVRHLTEDLGLRRIAILYQDDSFGRAGYDGLNIALTKRNLTLAAEGTFQRNTTAVKTALLGIRAANPEAIVTVGPYKPIAEFIKLARGLGMTQPIVNISFVGAEALARELGPTGEGVIVTQVVPLPWDSSIPVVAQYQKALKAYDPAVKPGFISLEGYLVGRLTIMALERLGPDVTREGLLRLIEENGTFDLEGLMAKFGPGDNQGLEEVFLTVIQRDGSFKQVVRLTPAS